MSHPLPLLYVEFTLNFLILLSLFINIILLMATVFKVKDYSLELVLLGMISFSVFVGFHEFMQITATSYEMAESPLAFTDSIMSEMFLLMASILIFGVAIIKKRLQNVKLGTRK